MWSTRVQPTARNYPANIMVFDVNSNGTGVGNAKEFADFAPGFTDGIRCDTDGNVWCGWGWGGPDTNGVRVHAPDGTLLAFLHTPEVIANLAFGGTKRNRLFMCRQHLDLRPLRQRRWLSIKLAISSAIVGPHAQRRAGPLFGCSALRIAYWKQAPLL